MSNAPPNPRRSCEAGRSTCKHLALRVLSAGKWQGKLIPIKVSPFLIGRHADCHLRPVSPQAERKQGALVLHKNSARIRKLAEKCEICVNGRPIDSEQDLHDGDSLEIGRLLFEVVVQAEPIRTPLDAGAQLSMDEETVGALLLAIQDTPRTVSLSRREETEFTKVTGVSRVQDAARGATASPDESDEMVWAARQLLQRYNNPRLRRSR
jgi:predicted component of type VI protein secretion system